MIFSVVKTELSFQNQCILLIVVLLFMPWQSDHRPQQLGHYMWISHFPPPRAQPDLESFHSYLYILSQDHLFFHSYSATLLASGTSFHLLPGMLQWLLKYASYIRYIILYPKSWFILKHAPNLIIPS